MVEQVFKFSTGNEKAVEKLIMDENVHYIHMVFNKEEGLPEHYSNSNVYMSVIRGKLSIDLDDQGVHKYDSGNLLNWTSLRYRFSSKRYKREAPAPLLYSTIYVLNQMFC